MRSFLLFRRECPADDIVQHRLHGVNVVRLAEHTHVNKGASLDAQFVQTDRERHFRTGINHPVAAQRVFGVFVTGTDTCRVETAKGRTAEIIPLRQTNVFIAVTFNITGIDKQFERIVVGQRIIGVNLTVKAEIFFIAA